MRTLRLALLPFVVAGTLEAQTRVPGGGASLDSLTLPTRAEATGFVETSRYEDVVAFLRTVDAASDRIHLTTMGYTSEGRPIPLAVVGHVPDATPDAVRATGKLRVYLQGNIHGGEVPGKEALQMLLRDLAMGDDAGWLDEMVLLVAPIYNADGNEKVALTNRPRQHGPMGGMGQRPNAQGLDLNRDHMKLDSPEARSFARMLTAYDPHVLVDLHTTNGTRHAYHLTYSPPLHPGTPRSVVGALRDHLLPAVTDAVRDAHDVEMYYYGNLSRGAEEPAWYTFDHRPRFNNNYAGLRNRLGILGEAYAYATLRERVFATRWFVEEILSYARDHRGALEAATTEADRSVVGGTLPTRATFARSDTMVTILMGDVVEERHPYTGDIILRRLPVERPERMWEYGTFRATDSEMVPGLYLVPPELDEVVERLEAHGIPYETTDTDRSRDVQEFALDSVLTAERPFQGHRERTLFGQWRRVRRTIPAGTAVVDVSQPLGRLAFYLLEPRSDDGLATWGILDDALEGAAVYPLWRVLPTPEG